MMLDKDAAKPYIAIIVLVCGVIGGLIVVISFIFCCKFCFKKKPPLASSFPHSGNQQQEQFIAPYQGKLKNESKDYYQILGNDYPVPKDFEAYLQQPSTETLEDVDEKRPKFQQIEKMQSRDFRRSGKDGSKQAVVDNSSANSGDMEENYVVENDEEDQIFEKVKKTKPEINSLELRSGALLAVQAAGAESQLRRSRAHSDVVPATKYDSGGGLLSPPDAGVELRRKSYEEQPKTSSVVERNDFRPPLSPIRRRLPSLKEADDYTREQERQRALDRSGSAFNEDHRANVLKADSNYKLPRDANALKQGFPDPHHRSSLKHNDHSQTSKQSCLIPNRAYSTDAESARLKDLYRQREMNETNFFEKATTQATKSFPNTYANQGSLQNADERHIQFTANRRMWPLDVIQQESDYNSSGATSSCSSAVTGGRSPIRLVKSVGIAGTHRMLPIDMRQAYSLDTDQLTYRLQLMNQTVPTIVTRKQDLYNEYQDHRMPFPSHQVVFQEYHKPFLSQSQQYSAHESPNHQQMGAECRNLWQLRTYIERKEFDENGYSPDLAASSFNNNTEQNTSLDLYNDDDVNTSPNSSFESNTEAFMCNEGQSIDLIEDLNSSKMTLEAKRAKLKNLYAKRQLLKQKQEVSVDSCESYETGDSFDSSKIDKNQSSFESNQASDSASDSVRRKQYLTQKDSGYKSHSLEMSLHRRALHQSSRPLKSPIVARSVGQYSIESNTGYPNTDRGPDPEPYEFFDSSTELESAAAAIMVDDAAGDSSDRSGIIYLSPSVNDSGSEADIAKSVDDDQSRFDPQPRRNRNTHCLVADPYSRAVFEEFSRFDPKYEIDRPYSATSRRSTDSSSRLTAGRERSIEEEEGEEAGSLDAAGSNIFGSFRASSVSVQ